MALSPNWRESFLITATGFFAYFAIVLRLNLRTPWKRTKWSLRSPTASSTKRCARFLKCLTPSGDWRRSEVDLEHRLRELSPSGANRGSVPRGTTSLGGWQRHLWSGTDLASQWAKQRQQELQNGHIDAILSTLNAHASCSEQARKNIDYFRHNRHRMQYATFRNNALCVSSGVVEAGCKNVNVRVCTGALRCRCHHRLA